MQTTNRARPLRERCAYWVHRPCRFSVLGYVLVLFAFAPLGTAPAAEEKYPEEAVKAVILYNLPEFAEWPEGRLPSSDRQLVVCVLGKMKFFDNYEIFQGERLKNRTLQIQEIPTQDESNSCHMVFLSPPKEETLPDLLKFFTGKGILTVSDFPDFAIRGGMIELGRHGENVHLTVNLAAANREGIQLSAGLLDLATIVTTRD